MNAIIGLFVIYIILSFLLSILLQTTDSYIYIVAAVITGLFGIVSLKEGINKNKENVKRYGKELLVTKCSIETDPINNYITVYEKGLLIANDFYRFERISDINVSEVIESGRRVGIGLRVGYLHVYLSDGRFMKIKGIGRKQDYTKIKDIFYSMKNHKDSFGKT